jgi:hypothetical protein
VAGELVNDDPQPLSRSRLHSRNLRRLPTINPNNIEGKAIAMTMPLGEGLIVMTVLSGPLPDRLAGANVQAHPLGIPVHAKPSDALNPFCGATETVIEPDLPCAMLRVLLESESV